MGTRTDLTAAVNAARADGSSLTYCPSSSCANRSAAEEVAQDEVDVLAALAEAAIEIREPVRAVGDVDPHAMTAGHQLVPAARAEAVEHLELEPAGGDLLDGGVPEGVTHQDLVMGRDRRVVPVVEELVGQLAVGLADVLH